MTKPIERGTLPSGHSYIIERTDPKGDAKRLALQLGSEINGQATQRLNAEYYLREASKWEDKAEEFRVLLDRIRRRDAGEKVETTSRMDPMLTYEAGAVAKQIKKYRETARKFREDAKEYARQSDEHQREFDRVQKKLAEVNACIED